MHPPRRRLFALSGILAIVLAAPLAVSAAFGFGDVGDVNVHGADIEWLKDAGVTAGCNPPANTNFCPGEPVLRQQMASFMRRFAENQVVDAGRLGGQEATAYETRVAAAHCGVEAGLATTCLGAIPDLATVEVLHVDLDAPAPGVVTNQLGAMTNAWLWLSLNQTCAPVAPGGEAIFTQALNGHLLGLETDTAISGSVAVAVPAGSHTIRLCAVVPTTTGSGYLLIGSLVAEWTAGGSVDVAGAQLSPIPDSFRQLLVDALGA